MPVPAHLRVSFRGRIVNTPEIWSTTHNLRRPSGFSDPTAGNPADNLDPVALLAAWRALAVMMDSFVHLTDIRVYDIGTDNRMRGNPVIHSYPANAEPAGTGSGTTHPPQIACCVTLEAPNRGAGRFGRFFVPLPAANLGPDLRITEQQALTWSGAAATFLRGLRDSYSISGAPDTFDANPINVSTRGGNGAGSFQVVETVRVGRALDTIRRRRNALDEAYIRTDL